MLMALFIGFLWRKCLISTNYIQWTFDVFVTGIQDLQGELSKKVPAHQTSPIPYLLHQAVHKEQLLYRKEPNHRQLPHHVCDLRCSGYIYMTLFYSSIILCKCILKCSCENTHARQERWSARVPHRRGAGYWEVHDLWPGGQCCSWWKTHWGFL